MRRFDDETLVAFVDGELDDAAAAEVARAVESDAELAARVDMFRTSSVMVRAAFADVIDEPVPDRLLAAARGPVAAADNVVPFRKRSPVGRWIALPLAASVAALMIGAGAGYWAGRSPVAPPPTELAASSGLVDNLAGYYDLYTVTGGEPEQMAFADMRTDERDGLQSWLTSGPVLSGDHRAILFAAALMGAMGMVIGETLANREALVWAGMTVLIALPFAFGMRLEARAARPA